MGDNGYFGPESMFWRVWSESVQLVGGQTALLLQIAHPLIAAGVADHSAFREDPMVRLNRTLDLMLTIIFGTSIEADTMLDHFRSVHRRVQGKLSGNRGSLPAGTPYRGGDPALKLWVHTTLMATGLDIFENFVTRLNTTEKVQFYSESLTLAHLLGIPKYYLPASFPRFIDYLTYMINSPQLIVDDVTLSLAEAILHPNVAGVIAVPVRLNRYLTAQLLPSPLRKAYRLPHSTAAKISVDRFIKSTRAALPLIPPSLRFFSQARRAWQRTNQQPIPLAVVSPTFG
jgi:uncharacterized protein (DUF2236 family)